MVYRTFAIDERKDERTDRRTDNVQFLVSPAFAKQLLNGTYYVRSNTELQIHSCMPFPLHAMHQTFGLDFFGKEQMGRTDRH